MDNRNFGEKLKDKDFRKKIVMGFYLMLLIFLAILIKTKPSKKENIKPTEEKNEVKEDIKKEEKDVRFKLILENNYNFEFNLNHNNIVTSYIGKRYNNKFNFTMKRLDESLSFIGTNHFLKMNNEKTTNVLPYYIIDYFNPTILENIIKASDVVDNIYKINNEKLNDILKLEKEIINKEGINTIKLVLKNNNIVEIFIDYTLFAKEFENNINSKKELISLFEK